MTIKVHADVPFGNVCDVEVLESPDTTEVRFAADPHGGPECLWFCFRVERVASEAKRLKLTLKHGWSMLGLHKPRGVRPVVRPQDADWERLGEAEVEELPDGRRLISWTVEVPDAFLDVAFCYPYGPDDVDQLIADCDGYWTADVIGVSQKARPIVRLSNTYGEEASDRPGIYVIARQHSSETTGSWVLDGFLRHVATLGVEAPMVWTVPLSNIDGVMQGDYGKDNFPYDLNRAWGKAPMRHETLVFQRDVNRWKKRCTPVLGIDFHSPGGAEWQGVYCFVIDADENPKMHACIKCWTDAVKAALGETYAADEKFARVADYASRWNTPSFGRYFWDSLDLPALCVETSYGMSKDLVLTREHYRDIGKRFAEGIVAELASGGETKG